MTMEILLIIAVLGFCIWGFSREQKIKRYQAEFKRLKQEADSLNAKLEDRFYLEAIFGGMEEEVMLINRYFEITDVNPAIAKAAGLPEEEIFGRHCYEILHNRTSPCEPPHGPCPFQEVFQSGKGRKVLHIHKDTTGEDRVVEISASPIKDEQGRVVQMIEVSRNVTEREQLKRQMIRSEKLSLIENFITDIYHDIIDPLNIISTNLQLIQLKWNLDEERLSKIENMNIQAKKINQKVADLLNLIKYSKGVASRIDINEVIQKILDLVEKEIAIEEIELRTELAGTSLPVSGKTSEFSQVFLNLIATARETMNRREDLEGPESQREEWKKILAIATRLSSDGEKVVLEIKDTGMEIPEEIIGELNDPLYRPESAFSNLFRRLSASYKIIEEAGGTLEIASSKTRGSAYLIRLPSYSGED